ncbi:hypothetical protein GCM10023185_46670 [Hymenobacter saemangeumensis]|uniref:DUF805 domain-containing protein n=1 Tax=Hymenobacter saemangeumensis TaxID=1084522 RepID=A0ABP8ISZ5_9BACT
MATESTEKGRHRYAWPLGINLSILLLAVGRNWPHEPFNGLALLMLSCINGLLGFVFLLFERRRDAGYTGGFFLSFLLLLLIGFGTCAKESKQQRQIEIEEVEAPESN